MGGIRKGRKSNMNNLEDIVSPIIKISREELAAKLVDISKCTNPQSRIKYLKSLATNYLVIYKPDTGDYIVGPFVLPRGLQYVQIQGLVLMLWIGTLTTTDWKLEVDKLSEDINKMMSPLVCLV